MKTISAELKAHMALGTTTIATLVRLERTDGEVFAVTLDHDMPITFDGDTYDPVLGMMPSTIETSGSLNVDNLDAKGALMLVGVSEADINSGLWDMCDVRVMRVNWADLTMGCEKIKRGYFGQISIGRDKFSSEIRGITQKLQQVIGDIVSPSCNADLFDARCGLTPVEGETMFSDEPVTTATSNQAFTASGLLVVAGRFNGGKVTWTTGLNTGLSKEIKSHATGGVIVLQEPMPYEIQEDDEATFLTGCRKRFQEDCVDTYDNAVNFRAFPFIPGQDQLYKGN
jgi:uncharacterized phage protein (TIGR02218 family)